MTGFSIEHHFRVRQTDCARYSVALSRFEGIQSDEETVNALYRAQVIGLKSVWDLDPWRTCRKR